MRRLPNYRNERKSLRGYSDKSNDRWPELGEMLEPYAKYDSKTERFCCNGCSYKSETYRAIMAHVDEELIKRERNEHDS